MDINCDMGESYGFFTVGNDAEIFPYITSCNIACGFHGGDPLSIEKTIQMTLNYQVQIGAHPSFPDLLGFGRKYMKLPADELKAIIRYQLAALKGMTESLGGKLSYVKPHGALYNSVADNEEEALTLLDAIESVDPYLAVMGLAGSNFEKIAEKRDVLFIREGFADRRYLPNGRLMPRTNKEALISTAEETVSQTLSIIKDRKVATDEGLIDLEVDSICFHGDNPLVVDSLKGLKKAAKENHIIIEKFQF